MHLSNSCLAEAYCQDSYTPETHDITSEAFCRARETFKPKKGEFRNWVGIQRSGVRREDWRFRQRVAYLEEVQAANEEECSKILRWEESSDDIFFNLYDEKWTPFLRTPKAIFNIPFRKEQKKIIRNLLHSVDRRSRIIIQKRFFEGKDLKRIAAELRITKSTVQRAEKKTLHIFREKLSKKGIILDHLVA